MNEYESYAVWSVVASSVIFAGVIVWIFDKYLAPAVASAQTARNEQIAAAERLRDRALLELAAVRTEQQHAEDAMAQMRLRAQSDSQRERERILQDARNEGDRIIRNAEGELDRARYAGQVSFRESLLQRAVAQARERAAREIDESLDARIVTTFAQSLKKSDGTSYAVAGEAQHG